VLDVLAESATCTGETRNALARAGSTAQSNPNTTPATVAPTPV
jgi:hypothetical protein